MTFYFAMINAWSLAWEALYGDMDKEYPIIDTSVGAGNTAFEDDGLDYEIDLINGASADYMADVDDMYSHHFTTYDDGMSLQVTEEQMSAHYFKYHEKEILKDIEEYVSLSSSPLCSFRLCFHTYFHTSVCLPDKNLMRVL